VCRVSEETRADARKKVEKVAPISREPRPIFSSTSADIFGRQKLALAQTVCA
jgi:hypothetical protein